MGFELGRVDSTTYGLIAAGRARLDPPRAIVFRVKRSYALAAAFVGLVVSPNVAASRYKVPVVFRPIRAPGGVFCIGGVSSARLMQQLARPCAGRCPLRSTQRVLPLVADRGTWRVTSL